MTPPINAMCSWACPTHSILMMRQAKDYMYKCFPPVFVIVMSLFKLKYGVQLIFRGAVLARKSVMARPSVIRPIVFERGERTTSGKDARNIVPN